MSYVKVTNGSPVAYSFTQLRLDNPDVSFPKNPSDAALADFDVFPLVDGTKPDLDIVTAGPIELIDGVWTQTYTGRNRTPDEYRSELTCTMRQARLALLERGFLDRIADSINLIPEPDKTKIKIEWEYGSTVDRTSVWVSILQPALGLTDEQMDELFEFAATL